MKMKKWQIILAATLGLLILVIIPMAALAAENDQPTATVTTAGPKWKGGLAIVAPRLAIVGQPMTLGVFVRADQEPMPGAHVWAVSKESIEAVKNELAPLRDNATRLEEKDYEAILTSRGFKLGVTGSDGRLTHTFEAPGEFVLVAFKTHYFPGFSGITVRGLPKTLGIKAPRYSPPAEPVTISVFQRGNQTPVAGVAVWAVGKEQAADLQADVAEIKATGNAQTTDWEAVVKLYGTKLGETNSDGHLVATFDNEGWYLLIAVEPGYIPAFTGILISTPETTTAIE